MVAMSGTPQTGDIERNVIYVVDDCGNNDGSLVAGAGEQLHDGWVHSHPAGDCHYRGADQGHSGATTIS